MSANEPAPKSMDEYIAAFPPQVQDVLQKIRLTIREAAPEAGEAIKYGMPTFTLNGNLVVSFAAYKSHIGLYPVPAGDEKFQEDLSVYRAEKSTVRLPLSRPIPYSLIARLVKFRVKETRKKAGTRGKNHEIRSKRTPDH